MSSQVGEGELRRRRLRNVVCIVSPSPSGRLDCLPQARINVPIDLGHFTAGNLIMSSIYQNKLLLYLCVVCPGCPIHVQVCVAAAASDRKIPDYPGLCFDPSPRSSPSSTAQHSTAQHSTAQPYHPGAPPPRTLIISPLLYLSVSVTLCPSPPIHT